MKTITESQAFELAGRVLADSIKSEEQPRGYTYSQIKEYARDAMYIANNNFEEYEGETRKQVFVNQLRGWSIAN